MPINPWREKMSKSNIDAPNYTQIPNIVFDFWMEKLNSSEFKILLCLCRKIFGWHKTSDFISTSQLAKCTGLTKKTVISSVSSLMQQGLVLKSTYCDQGMNQVNEYKLNIEIPEDEVYSKRERPEGNFSGGSVNITPGGSVKITPTKERLNKIKEEKEYKEKERGGYPPTANAVPPSCISNKSPSLEKEIIRKQNVKTTETDHQKLIEKFGEEFTNACYERLSLWKLDTPKAKWKKSDYRSILRWVAEAERESAIKKSKTSTDCEGIQENIEFAEKVAENFNASMAPRRDCRIDVLRESVEIVFTKSMKPPIVIKFTEKGFKDQLENALRKAGLL